MINGVLVERTVKDVVPALKTNSEGLKQVLDELVLQYKSKQDEMEKWKVECPASSGFQIGVDWLAEEKQHHRCSTIITT
jgi:hypothetical protein